MRLPDAAARELVARVALVWVRMYTFGVLEQDRLRRLGQVESDIWEHRAERQNDHASPWMIELEILGRTVRGLADDMFWRLKLEGPRMPMKIAIGSTTLALLAIDFFEFHDVLEAKTLPEYLTGIVSVPILFLLLALLTGWLRLERS